MSKSLLDPITLGVIWGGLQSITVEVGTTVHRTAHSQQAREGQDFSVCLFDPAGRMTAQGPYSPGHMGAMGFAAKNAIAAFPGEPLRPGDVVLFNSPHLGSGHFPDFFMIQPAFHEDGRLIGFAANILHHTDVGGMRPGSQAVEGVSDFFQEGLHVPPVKLWKGGEEQEGLLAVILANTRMPDSMLGDLRAQRNSLRVGELRLQELVQRYGYDTVQAAMIEIMDRTEARVREAIRAIPDGVYPFEDFMDDYGPGTPPMRLFVTVTVRGDEVLVDFDGTGPQTESGLNSYINYTRSYCYAAVKCLTDPDGPQNDGALPAGPHRGAGRLLPESAPAGWWRPPGGLLLPALRRGRRRAGPRPARPRDGGRLPLRQPDLWRLRPAPQPPDGGVRAGALRHRGPPGPRRVRGDVDGVQRLQHPVRVAGGQPARPHRALRADPRLGRRRDVPWRHRDPPRHAVPPRRRQAHQQHRATALRPVGALRRPPGKPGVTLLNPGTPGERRVHSKASDTFAYGDVVSFQQPGAGGYGPPWERDPRAVLRDVLEDYVSIEGARRDYGVVIDPATLTVDEPATQAARAAMRVPGPLPVVVPRGPLW